MQDGGKQKAVETKPVKLQKAQLPFIRVLEYNKQAYSKIMREISRERIPSTSNSRFFRKQKDIVPSEDKFITKQAEGIQGRTKNNLTEDIEGKKK